MQLSRRDAGAFKPRLSALVLFALLLSGCAATKLPRNDSPIEAEGGYQAAQRSFDADERTRDDADDEFFVTSLRADLNLRGCQPNPEYDRLPLLPDAKSELPITKGDLLRVTVLDDDMLSGDFEIEEDGMLRLPQMRAVRAKGFPAGKLEKIVQQALVSDELYQPPGAPVSVKVIDRAPIRVPVSGAVFEPGSIEIAQKFEQERDPLRQTASGDLSNNRALTGAIRGAAGVRPDADVRNVLLRRGGKVWRVDLMNAALDRGFHDPFLLSGDEVFVPSLGCFQPGLAKPNIITRKGIKVQLSNLTVPALRNSASAIEEDARSLKYGTTLLQILFKMNCVGGTALTNADRSAIVISSNPITGKSEVIRRRIEDLIRRADRDEHNPILMPDDSIACYDSTVTNARDVMSAFRDIVTPFSALSGL